MKSAALAFLLCLASAVAQAATSDQPASSTPAAAAVHKIVFKNNGFAIAPLDEEGKSGRNLVLTLFLPGADEFGPSVNVEIQKYDGDMFEYRAKRMKLHDEMKDEVIVGMTQDDSFYEQFVRTIKGRRFRVVERALTNDGILYIITATAAESEWKKVGEKLEACVKSFDPDYRTEAEMEEKDKLLFTNNHFHVASLDERPSGTGANRVLAMYLPVSADLKPNVTVTTERFTGPMSAYLAKWKKEGEAYKFKVLSSKIDGDTMLTEFTNVFRGQAFHGYLRSVLKGGIVYNAGAAAPEEQWKSVVGKLKTCVDSLEVLPAAKPAAAAAKSAVPAGVGK